jgi:predicted nucleic acid-binding protein
LAAAEAMFAEDFAGRVFGLESDAAPVFARIAARRRTLGRPIRPADRRIACIARVRQAKLATRNLADFEECGVEIVDP